MPPTQQKIVQDNIEDYLFDKLNDVESYEFVKLDLIDSITFSNNIEFRRKSYVKKIESDEYSLNIENKFSGSISSDANLNNIVRLEESIAKNKRILSVIDSITDHLGDNVNKVASYTYHFAFRANNSLGVKTLSNFIVQTDTAPSFRILNLTDNENEVFLTPNGFPGYDLVLDLLKQKN
ncbi:MAG: hypothetical protein LAT81_09880 [Oceanicaulis sp.]|nr:hypothetical protein [Oceanicaulis sp.]